MSDVGPDDAARRVEIATLQRQVAALADFVTTITAAPWWRTARSLRLSSRL